MAYPTRLSISTLLLIVGALALRPDPVGLIYAPVSLGKRQAFEGTLGGSAPVVTHTGDSERPYGVNGDTFTDYTSAAERSCNNQFTTCQKIANTDKSAPFSLQDCQNQLSDCMSATSSTSIVVQAVTTSTSASDVTTVIAQLAQIIIPYDDEFDLVCDLPGKYN